MSKNLGEFEILVLVALVRLTPEAYGVSIREEIEDQTERQVTVGALYATLNRLEKKQYVTTRMGEATAERGGRAKRFYEITPLGQSQLKRAMTSLKNMVSGTDLWSNQAIK